MSKAPNERRRGLRPSRLPRYKLRSRGYFAEVIEDRRSRPPLVTCVIQREDSTEILALSQFTSRPAAEQWAWTELHEYSRRAAA